MTDLVLDTDYDLEMNGNNVKLSNGVQQHQELLLVMNKGEFKENPIATVGIVNYLRDDNIPGMLQEVRTRFINDGMDVRSIGYDEENGSLKYEADYKIQ
ncbi:MAG: hypothetical protein IPH58_05610 [Sphingobacteriales bacterium]|jgi:hypothetical protein|nr:hypothetical protein [Sphingobacteriales bacterium]